MPMTSDDELIKRCNYSRKRTHELKRNATHQSGNEKLKRKPDGTKNGSRFIDTSYTLNISIL